MTCMSTLGVVVQHDGLLEITYMQVYNPHSARLYLLELIRHGLVVGSLFKTVKVVTKADCNRPSSVLVERPPVMLADTASVTVTP